MTTPLNNIRIIIHLPNNPGDVMMGLEACSLLKKSEPNLSIEYIVDSESKSLLNNLDFLDKIHLSPRQRIREDIPDKSFDELQDFINQLNPKDQSSNTLFVNFFQGESGALLANLVQAKAKVGLEFNSEISASSPTDFWSRYLYSIPAQRNANCIHAVDLYFNIVQSALWQNFNLKILKPTFKLAIPSYTPFELNGYNFESKTLLLQPNSAWAGKCWPKNKWIDFLNILATQEHGFEQIVFLGAPQDSVLIFEIMNQINNLNHLRVINTCGQTQISDLFPLLQSAELLITGDTFAMHAAAWVKCPTIALFGPSSAIETGPYQSGATIIESNSVNQGDYQFQTLIHPAMDSISPQDLINHITKTKVNDSKLYESHWVNQSSFIESIFDHQAFQPNKVSISLRNHPRSALVKSEFLEKIQFEFSHSFLDGQYQILKQLKEQPTPLLLNQLENNEKQAFEKLDNSLFWEIYRIELNSIAVNPIHNHISLRSELILRWIEFLNKAENL